MGLLIEIMVSVLLAVTIHYCVMLNRRLKIVKDNEETFRKLVADLGAASVKAEAAVPGLRVATAEAEKALGDRQKQADVVLQALQMKLEEGEDILQRIAAIVAANRAAEKAEPAIVTLVPAPVEKPVVATNVAERGGGLSEAAKAAREIAMKARQRQLPEAA
jgi:hypothetical protein